MTDHHVPLAIVGVSALFPGSTDATGFWRDILAGRDLIRDVPPSHWLIEDYYDPDPSAPDKTYSKRGAFLDDVAFDPLKFGVPPSIVPATDTSQLLALIVAQQVLEDATHGALGDATRDRTSVILGVTSGQELLASMVSRLQRPVWANSLRDAGVAESKVEEICERIAAHYVPWQESSFPGLLGNVVAGRIANRLDLGGTNCVTDAACASTFAALSMAANELYLGESELVICGGVDTLNDIFMYMCFSKTPALSPTGDCRPFSERADGTLLGEGMAMVALKRLADAEQNGDPIYAVLRGIGSSSDGRAKSVYAPRPEGQAKALLRAYEHAGYGPDSVELVEAHGTATKAGDAAEFAGLRAAFDSSGRTDRQWCALGSVKSQIGHTKAAAGAAGLFKTVMALHHKVLPPTIKVESPNPELSLPTSPFYLNTETRPWVRKADHPRRAAVSSFGFGGSNFHLTLEEYTGAARKPRLRAAPDELVLFGADTPGELLARLRDVDAGEGLAFLARQSQADWAGKVAGARLAIVAKDEQDLRAKLADALTRIESSPDAAFSTPRGVHYGVGAGRPPVALLFPGQGSQYVGMGAELAMAYDAAIGVWDLAATTGLELHDVVFPTPVFDDAARGEQSAKLMRTEWAQPAIGATSLSYLRLLRTMGLEPHSVGGHSYGEVTALCAAGVFDEAAMLRLARTRGELMAAAAAQPGAMIAVSAKLEELRPIVEPVDGLVVANHNAPTQVVLSGPLEAVEKARAELRRLGISFRDLPVHTAFHSSVVSASVEPFRKALRDVEMRPPTVPVYANSLAAPYSREIVDVLAEQIANPVRFVEQIEAMYAAGARVFLEVGPGSVLTGLTTRILEGREHLAVSVDRQGKHGISCLHEALAALVASGVALDLTSLFAPYEVALAASAAGKPKMVLQLNGSNYGKPYPPKNGAAGRTPPNLDIALGVSQPAHLAAQERPNSDAPTEYNVTDSSKGNATSNHASGANGQGTNGGSQAYAAPARVAGAAPSAHALRTSPTELASVTMVAPAWTHSYQEMQRQTAEAHMSFQNAMAQAHIAFLQTAEQAMTGLASMVTGSELPAGRQLAYAPQALTAPAALAYVAHAPAPAPIYAAPAPVHAAAPVYAPAHAAPPPAPSPAPVHAAPAPSPAPAPAPAPAVAAASAAPAPDMTALLLEVVAEKTGYPAEMLSLEMALEADLGIDSIKRVEILASIRARQPNLPDVDTKEMAKLATLGDVVTYMKSSLGGNGASKESSPPKVGSAATP
ncbi:MAG: acyltransferase domain-containing protein [Myxococcales bacterium]|nr:acyltransferase domain-containing protein [Myxococcales bacterium]